jgi:hypothetical protein
MLVSFFDIWKYLFELELELIQTQTAQKQYLFEPPMKKITYVRVDF